VRVVATDSLSLLHEVADAVAVAFAASTDRGPAGGHPGQYSFDVVADDVALDVLRSAGYGVLSEESGMERGRRDEVVVIDPIDGSTNASRGIPWYATALCVVDADGPAVALVADQASGRRWWAVRGSGARVDDMPLRVSGCTDVAAAIVGLNGIPPVHLGQRQSRMLGAAALDISLVAAGSLDAYVDCAVEAHGVWDYLGAALICREAGGVVIDAFGRPLAVLDHAARRTPVAAASMELATVLAARRRGYADQPPGA
jgi:fructose-1,6-bisphosphatase/inositol monophosphatase family enzyme